jgi:hypothetical protein
VLASESTACERGGFTFDPKTDSNLTGQAALFELTFTHVANNCPISCGNYWFVQVIRLLDLDSAETSYNPTAHNRTGR